MGPNRSTNSRSPLNPPSFGGDSDTCTRPDDSHMSLQRPPYLYVLAVIGVFAALGAGLGLAANFTLGFFIEQ